MIFSFDNIALVHSCCNMCCVIVIQDNNKHCSPFSPATPAVSSVFPDYGVCSFVEEEKMGRKYYRDIYSQQDFYF